MQASVENTGTLGRKLVLKIPADRLDKQVDERIVDMTRTVRLKGFRPGRVPARIVRQRFGAQVRSEILSDLIGEGLRDTFKKEELQPAAQPVIDSVSDPEDGEITCVAQFEVMPELPELDVSDIQIERPQASVEDGDIDEMIETLRKQRRTFAEVERAAAEGDLVDFEYAVVTDDYRHPEEGYEKASSVLEDGALFEGMQKLLKDNAAGAQVKDEVDFPEDFPNQQLAGKKATVEARLLSVKEGELPALDKDFFALFGTEVETLEDFREEVRGNLERELKASLGMRLKQEVADKLAAKYDDVEIPKALVDNEARAMLGVDGSSTQELPEDVLERVRPNATKRVRAALLMGEIARKQELKLDQERLRSLMISIASTYEEPQKVLEMYTQNERMMSALQSRVMEEQVADWVAAHANSTDKALSFADVMQSSQA